MRSSEVNGHFAPRLLTALILLALLGSSAVAESLAEAVLKLTGARTRIVWLHGVHDVAANNWDAISADYELKGFDTAEGKARVILPGPASYANPCITPDGQRVLFTDTTSNTLYIVNWDGSGKTELTKGYVLCTWIDPNERTQWVYFTDQGYSKGQLTRCRIDKPSVREVVWSKEQAAHTLTVSADGTRAGSEFPWPAAGVAILPNVSWKRYGTGCNGCIAPDNSYRFFHMGDEVSHDGVIFYDKDGANRRVIRFRGDLPGDSWIPRWTNDVRFLTVNSPIGGKDADIYLGQFNPAFTAVAKWVRITNQPGHDTKACGWVGRMPRPEAKPLIPAPAVRKAPVAAVARLLDEAHLEVIFSEQVQLKDASASLASMVPVAALALDPEGFRLIVTLGGRMPGADTLLLKGISDCLEPPHPVKEKVAVARPAWPVNRANLVFQWCTAKRPTFQFNPAGGAFDRVYLSTSRIARLNRDGAMTFHGGGFSVADAGNGIVAECSKANQFSVEVLITPSGVQQAPTTEPRFILGCDGEGEADKTNFALAQEGLKLVLLARTMPDGKNGAVQRVPLCTLEEQKPNHVVVAYRPGRLACYLNGKPVKQTSELQGALDWRSANGETGLYFASRRGAPNPWLGELEGIAVFARALDAADAAADHAIYARMLATRKAPPPRIELEAILAKTSQIPKPSDIAPYRDALVVNEFIVTKVIGGQYKQGKVRVAQWGMIDTQPTGIAQANPGDAFTLVLEPMKDHPELESEAIRDTLDQNSGLALYLDLTVR